MNAIKHGFFSKWLLVQHSGGKESQGEYDDFYADVFKHYQPVGWLEENWVDKIAVWSWRLRRVIRYESGQIARALANTGTNSSNQRQMTQKNRDLYQPAALNWMH